ncbi:MAG: SusD/RagB family nutrient-binding outer membrane lipoprotein [Bacteroidota bacterium]|nr:SusD/RagB family nutrient-binding outer membrane lipoprotein [Bacteroidota bacterium]
MKSFSIKVFAIVLMVTVASCSKDALRSADSLQQLNAVESVNDPYLLSSVIKQSALFYQGMGYETSRLPSAVQYMERNYQGGDNTYQGFKQPIDDMYSAMNILKLVDGAIGLADKRGSMVHKGIFTIFRVLLFSFMTDFYGDVYYSQALKARDGILYPKYDKQADIYAGLLKELDDANTLIANGTEPISSTYDLVFQGDKLKWQEFANSLKLRLLMRESNKVPGAAAQIAAIVSNPSATPVFSTADDNVSISYIGSTAANSWQGGTINDNFGSEFDRRRPCKTLVDELTRLNDPRLQVWIAPVEDPWTSNPAMDGVTVNTTDPNGFTYTSTWEYIDRSNPEIAQYATPDILLDSNKLYVGFEAGMFGDYKNGNGHYNTAAGGAYGNFKVSKFSQLFRQNSHPLLKAMIMQSDEVQFILAEAAAKGMISGSADTYYRNGIRFSMKRWGVSDADINTYLAQSSIALPGDQAGQLAQIADQKWLGLFFVSAEAYLDLRRTKLPDMFNNGLLSNYQFPLRYRYPGNELGQNVDAYNLGVQGLSPQVDDQYSKMWLLQ